jgi:hypothetical protein
MRKQAMDAADGYLLEKRTGYCGECEACLVPRAELAEFIDREFAALFESHKELREALGFAKNAIVTCSEIFLEHDMEAWQGCVFSLDRINLALERAEAL